MKTLLPISQNGKCVAQSKAIISIINLDGNNETCFMTNTLAYY